MGEIKTKKARRRVIKAANSPAPDPACGHGGCGMECAVRYVGPTSHVRDHHIVHAARGVAHVWTAAVVTGFALVLTGAIAFNVAQASTDRKMDSGQQEVKQDLGREIQQLSAQIEELQSSMKRLTQTYAEDALSE